MSLRRASPLLPFLQQKKNPHPRAPNGEMPVMVQGYYNLQEAAEFLSLSQDELKSMAQRKEIRSFQDRGTLRFRIQDVQELARKRGSSSDPDLVLGEAGPVTAAPATPPRMEGPRTPAKQPKSPEVFGFSLDATEEVGVGEEVLGETSSSPKPGGPKSE